MTIKFLGTAAAWPLPRLGCQCPICTSPNLKDKRKRSALLIDNTILIDAGPDIYSQLIDQNPEKLDSVFITHAHHDHILGIHDLGHIYNRQANLKIFTTQAVINQIKKKFEYNLTPLKLIPVKEAETVNVGRYKIVFFPVEHVRQPTYGVKIRTTGKFLIYIPDLAKLPKNSQSYVKDAHLLILDGSSLTQIGQTKSHLNIEQGVALAQNLKAKRVYFTHIGHKTQPHDELEAIVRNLGGKHYHIAFDGLTIELD